MDYNYTLKKVTGEKFIIDSDDDHIIEVFKIPYTDIEIFSVLYYDAYRVYSHEFLTKKDIFEKYRVKLDIHF